MTDEELTKAQKLAIKNKKYYEKNVKKLSPEEKKERADARKKRKKLNNELLKFKKIKVEEWERNYRLAYEKAYGPLN